MMHSSLNSQILLYSKWSTYLAQFAMRITYIKINDGRKFGILYLTKLTFFSTYPFLKPHIGFYINGLAIWHVFQISRILK